MDDDGVIRDVPLTIRARIWTTGDGELHVDLAGSAAQSPGGINVPWASSHAAVYFGVRAFCGSAVPQNDGLTRHMHLHCEEGGLLRPRFPAAVSTRHIAVQRLTDVVVEALGDLLPDRAVAAAHVSFPTFVIQATDPRNGRVTIMTDILGGGGGARPGAAGDARSTPTLQLRAPAGGNRRAGVPVADRAHRAGRRLRRHRPHARRGRRCCATTRCSRRTASASTTSSRRTRRSRPRARRRRARSTGRDPAAPRRHGHVRAAARQGRGAHAPRRHWLRAAGRRRRRLRRSLTLESTLREPACGSARARAARTSGSCPSRLWELAEDHPFGVLKWASGCGRRRSARLRGGGAGPQLDESARHLAPEFVGLATTRGLDGRVTVEHALDLHRRDVLAAGDDDVLGTVPHR